MGNFQAQRVGINMSCEVVHQDQEDIFNKICYIQERQIANKDLGQKHWA